MLTFIRCTFLFCTAIALSGCRSGKISGQPPLHIPESWDHRKSTNATATPSTSTALDTADSDADTNAARRGFLIRPKTRSEADTNVVAYMQIMTDADAREEFGLHFSKYFYVGE